MKCRLPPRREAGLVLLCLLVATAAIQAEGPPIRLRNETILPGAFRGFADKATVSTNSTLAGLFLVQFVKPASPAELAQVASAGAELLRYVPENTFVARFRRARLDQLQSLPFVQWVGEYRPEHKVHLQVRPALSGRPADEVVAVGVLLVPHASAGEIAAARSSFGRIQQESSLRAGTVLRGTIPAGKLDVLAKSDAVLWIEPAPQIKLFDEVSSKIVAGDGGPGRLLAQSLGFDGAGVKVAVADSGLNNGDAATMHPDLFGRTPSFFYYGTLTDAADEHSHGTHVAGIIAGNGATGETDGNGALYGLGVAPGASIIAQRIFDAAGGFESPPSFEKLTRDATRAGAVIGSNSWGDDTQGRYDISAMEFDELVRDADALTANDQQYILEFSAGNAGPGQQTVGSPAVAKNVISTGASENDRPDMVIYSDGPDAMADFSSRGPAEDGRIKPDVVAPGTWISSLQSESATDIYAWSPIDDLYQFQGGTSQAGPHASGAAAVFVQFYRQSHNNATPSPALVKAALINSATDMDDSFGTGPVPNADEGWGRLDLTPFFDSARSFRYVDQTLLLTNGQVFEQSVVVATGDEPLKITLAYTDPPALPAAIPTLVNDLDLEVIGPVGDLYRGNQLDQGESIPNPPARDSINNVEAVLLANPQPGEYLVRVRGRNVVADVHGEASGLGQDFALVTSGVLASSGRAVISLDRGTYTVPSRVRVALVDTDLAGHANATVTLRSSTEPGGESLILNAATSSGSFTGSVATATGPARSDGLLQIANNDLIQAIYFDASTGSNQSATAFADLFPPTLSGISVTNAFGQTIVSWNSSEPSMSLIFFGTNSSLATLALSATNSEFTTQNSISLDQLVVGQTNYFYVVSVDAAGNAGTNSNNGILFSFVVAATAPLLLVDEYQDPTSGAPPLSGYTDALDAIGFGYDIWDVGVQGGPPSPVNLRAYRAVLWRVPDLTGGWTLAEQTSISNYLSSGGALFVASMELLSRLEDEGATNFIHKVLKVQSYIVDPNSTGASEILGSPVEPVGAGLDIVMDYSLYSSLWSAYILFGLMPDPPDLSDTLTPSSDSTVVLHNDVGNAVGLRWPGLGKQAPGRLVVLTFPLDAVPMQSGVNDRIALLHNIISFLAPGISGAASLSFDSAAYTLPSLVTIQLGDSRLAGLGSITGIVSSTTQTNGVSVTLFETPDTGVFVGSLPLISATNPVVSGKLRATGGDKLTARAFDSAAGIYLTQTATVDTNPPSITGISTNVDYDQAVISWTTSEPTDALVQFGTSPLLGRTAYDPGPATSHSVTMRGLVPDRTYYYQVVSTDVAGNTSTDNNHGQLHRLHTLRPVVPPWSDNLDSGATNWSFFSADGSKSDWTLGVPRNGRETSAHSPPNAWGSNLNGLPVDYVETYLISPAIYLTNGNTATLGFWHSYDFTDSSGLTVEQGELDLVSNNGTSQTTLATYSDQTIGWEQVQLDLTPYIGQVVYLVWSYLVYSFDTAPHPGWLVDDVSVTVANVLPGTVQVSNNLWQASYILSGPMYQKAKGPSLIITNAPPGQYILEFADVPYYITPAAQSNNLAPGGTLMFQGIYTFPDVNNNGISDLWEQQCFGAVSTNRTHFTDTDGDGMSDYAEFIAGTDPLNPPPPARLTSLLISNTVCRIEWPAFPTLQYRMNASSNLTGWIPYSGWMAATGTIGRLDAPVSASGPHLFFKLEIASTNQNLLPPNLRLTIQPFSSGVLRFDWPSVPGRGYQLLSTANSTVWLPVNSWTQAISTKTTYSISNSPVATSPRLFRLEVRP